MQVRHCRPQAIPSEEQTSPSLPFLFLGIALFFPHRRRFLLSAARSGAAHLTCFALVVTSSSTTPASGGCGWDLCGLDLFGILASGFLSVCSQCPLSSRRWQSIRPQSADLLLSLLLVEACLFSHIFIAHLFSEAACFRCVNGVCSSWEARSVCSRCLGEVRLGIPTSSLLSSIPQSH